MNNRNYRAGMHMAYGLAIFVALLFVTSVVTAVTLEPPQFTHNSDVPADRQTVLYYAPRSTALAAP